MSLTSLPPDSATIPARRLTRCGRLLLSCLALCFTAGAAAGAAPEILLEQPLGRNLASSVAAWGENTNGQTTVPAGLADTTSVAAGWAHTVALRAGGTVIGWGDNGHGQCTPPPGLAGVTAIAAGRQHTVALKGDGTVAAWGSDFFGQASVPAGLGGVTAIAAGGYHTVALKSDGTLAAWGQNGTGQTDIPAGLTGVASIAAGDYHTVALKRDGSIIAWGYNYFGQTTVPAGLTGVTAIAARGNMTSALKSDGTVVHWGENAGGVQTPPAILNTATTLAQGWNHSLALRSAGTVAAWGSNACGQTSVPPGFASMSAIAAGGCHSAAVRGSARIDFAAQSAGTTSAAKVVTIRNVGTAALAVRGVSVSGPDAQDFTLDRTGLAASVAATGASTTVSLAFTPRGSGLRTATLRVLSDDSDEATLDVALTGTGLGAGLSITGNGLHIPSGDVTPSLFDHTDFGSAGAGSGKVVRTFTLANDGTRLLTLTGTPRIALSGPGAAAFSVVAQPASPLPARSAPVSFQITFSPARSGLHTATVSVATDSPGESPHLFAIQGTGLEAAPDIEVEEPAGTTLPVTVVTWGNNSSALDTVPAGLTGAASLTAGSAHSVVLKNDGTVAAWGNNFTGQTSVPPGLGGVVSLSAGANHTLALKADRTVAGWGTDSYYDQSVVPAGLRGAMMVAAGGTHSVVLLADGSLVTWGGNVYGQSDVPAGLTGVKAVAAGGTHTLALRSDGSVAAWGNNNFHQTEVPAGLSGVTALAGGGEHSVVLKADGTVAAWGRNDSRQATVPAGLTGVVAIAAGQDHTMVLKSDGTLVAWGADGYGQSTVPAGLAGVCAIACGGFHSLAVQRVVDFGSRDVRAAGVTRTFTIRNTGTAPLSLSRVSVTGADPSDFTTDTSGLTGPIPPGGSATLAFRFAARGLGRRSATLALFSNDPDEPSFNIALTGTGTGLVPEIEVRGAGRSLVSGSTTPETATGTDFGSTDTAFGTVVKNFTLANTGTAPLNLAAASRVVLGGLGAADFTVTVQPAAVVAAGASTTFQISFNPSATGPRSAVATLLNDDADESPFTFAIAGTGTTPVPDIAVEQPVGRRVTSSLEFTGQTVGVASAEKVFALKNAGSAALSITSVTLTGDQAGDFLLNAALVPASLPAPGGSATFTLAFRPTAAGLRQATLSLASDDPDTPAFDLLLIGTGLAPEPNLVLESPAGVSLGRQVVAWGAQSTGADYGQTAVPAGLKNVTALAAGLGHSLALRADGTVAAWGDDFYGQSTLPSGLSGVTSIAAGDYHTVVRKNDATLAAWGWNVVGQTSIPATLGPAASAEAGFAHTVALRSDGTVAAWGHNPSGQSTVPTSLAGAIAVAAGGSHSVALRSSGTVVAWGDNTYGQLAIPASLAGVTAISTGSYHTLALKSDGTVAAWGYNAQKQCDVPPGLTGVRAIDAGSFHSVALKNDGTVVAWGFNVSGQCNIPAGLGSVTAIAAGASHTLALTDTRQIDFGPLQATGRGAPRTFTVRNTGHAPLALTSVATTGGNAGDFLVTIPSLAAAVPGPGGSTTFTVTFSPTATGPRSTTLRLASNDPHAATFDVFLSGTGTTPLPALTVYASAPVGASSPLRDNGDTILLPKTTLPGGTTSHTFTVVNSGLAPLTFGALSLAGPSQPGVLTVTQPASTLAPGGSTTFTLQQTPAVVAGATAVLEIPSNDPATARFRIPVRGRVLGAAYAAWRVEKFGTSADTPASASTADPDTDGLANLMEFALGSDPASGRARPVPAAAFNPATRTWTFTYTRTKSAVTSGLLFTVEWSPQPGGQWQPVTQPGTPTDLGTAERITTTFPAPAGRLGFIRLRVSEP